MTFRKHRELGLHGGQLLFYVEGQLTMLQTPNMRDSIKQFSLQNVHTILGGNLRSQKNKNKGSGRTEKFCFVLFFSYRC